MSLVYSQEIYEGRVVGVPSGDEILFYKDNRVAKYRLAFVDAPEFQQRAGRSAQEYLSKLCFMKDVSVRMVQKESRSASYVLIMLGTQNINKEIVKAGWAWVVSVQNAPDIYLKLEQSARQKKIGLWQFPNPLEPWVFRERVARAKRSQQARRPAPNHRSYTEYAGHMVDLQKQMNRQTDPYEQAESYMDQIQSRHQRSLTESPLPLFDISGSNEDAF